MTLLLGESTINCGTLYGVEVLMVEITEQEFIDNLDSDDFFRRYGNPVKFNADGRYLVAMSFELYERLFGKLDLPDILGEGKEKQNVSSN